MAQFKASSRTLDMLGQQQIAGIPTAISEIFKNAYDAYADRVEVDFLRADKLLLIRDDGLGMSRKTFEERWLTLGTPSKLRKNALNSTDQSVLRDPTKPVRPIQGEKGIGRLAISVIGPQVLVLTRPKYHTDTDRDQLTVAFINWGIFALPGLNLNEIEVPIDVFPGGQLPSGKDIRAMVEKVRQNLRQVVGSYSLQDREFVAGDIARIERELASFSLDPKLLDALQRGPSLAGPAGHGTHFYVQPTNDILILDVDGEADKFVKAPLLFRRLIGFTNVLDQEENAASGFKTVFRNYSRPDSYTDILDSKEFFTTEEFANADHQISGRFDEYGQFEGLIKIYGESLEHYRVSWNAGRNAPTQCGAFEIKLGYIQGSPRDSTLPPEDHARILEKLNLIGGLYVYRDDIRILPYGDNDYDWLDIERRRTLNAAYYFFSYRRMFGFVDLRAGVNDALNEKAGREGFRENQAYRQLTSILRNFFTSLAADLFRPGGANSERFLTRRDELARTDRALSRRQKDVQRGRNELNRFLDRSFQQIEEGQPEKQIAELLQSAETSLAGTDDAPAKQRAVNEIRSRVAALAAEYNQPLPIGVSLSRPMRAGWEIYQSAVAQLEEQVFTPALERLEELQVQASDEPADQQKQRLLLLQSAFAEANAEIERGWRGSKDANRELSRRLDTFEAAALSRTGALRADSATQSETRGGAVGELHELQQRLSQIVAQERANAQAVTVILQSIQLDSDSGELDVTSLDMLAALEEQVLALEEQVDENAANIQLGMAVAAINHEFQHSVLGTRRALRGLSGWASRNASLRPIYEDLRTNFEYLDGYLTLFTPLQRRLYRRQIEITGRDIFGFLDRFFQQRLSNAAVELQATPDFLGYKLSGFPSTFYPVFINLIDNSLHWLRNTVQPRTIRLDVEEGGLTVTDSGPGIPERDREVIFEQGFTRKIGGRGLGLYLSRRSLEREGYRLTVLPNRGGGAKFLIRAI